MDSGVLALCWIDKKKTDFMHFVADTPEIVARGARPYLLIAFDATRSPEAESVKKRPVGTCWLGLLCFFPPFLSGVPGAGGLIVLNEITCVWWGDLCLDPSFSGFSQNRRWRLARREGN